MRQTDGRSPDHPIRTFRTASLRRIAHQCAHPPHIVEEPLVALDEGQDGEGLLDLHGDVLNREEDEAHEEHRPESGNLCSPNDPGYENLTGHREAEVTPISRYDNLRAFEIGAFIMVRKYA